MDPLAFHSPHPDIHIERDGHIVTVTLDRPRTKNACDGEMFVSLGVIFQRLSYSGARAIVLTGAGGDFCAGADLSRLPKRDPGQASSQSGGPSSSTLDGMRVLGDVVVAVHSCPVPVIAKVDGVCVGAGLGIALAADLTWCSDRARLSAIFVKRGLSLDFGTSWFLRQRLGVHKAKELALTGKMITAQEALTIGLVNAVEPVDQLDRAVQEVAESIAAGPPIAISASKRALNSAGSSSLLHSLEHEALAQSVNTHSEDTREALMAFAERRTPVFKGR